jgi:hypothetical protein
VEDHVTSDDNELAATAAAILLKQDRVTLKATDPRTGALLGRMRFTVTERDDTGLPVTINCEQL